MDYYLIEQKHNDYSEMKTAQRWLTAFRKLYARRPGGTTDSITVLSGKNSIIACNYLSSRK